MSGFDLNSTSIVVDNENSRIKFNGGGSHKHIEPNVSNQHYRNTSFVYDRTSTATFNFKGPWVKVHGSKQWQYYSPVGSISCSISPQSGTPINAEQGSGGSSFDTVCGFENLSPSNTYTLTITGTNGSSVDYVEYGASSPKAGDILRFYPRNPNFSFVNTVFAYGYARMPENSSFNFTYTGASTVTAYVQRPDTDWPIAFNVSYDFAKQQTFKVSSQTLGWYLPLRFNLASVVKYGSHWFSFIPDRRDRPVLLDFVELPYTSAPNVHVAREIQAESMVAEGIDARVFAGDAAKGALGLLFCVGMLFWYLSSRRTKAKKGDKWASQTDY